MNDELRMAKENAQMKKEELKSFRHSDFVSHSAFGIRHSAFLP
jgi:hypothetical protein